MLIGRCSAQIMRSVAIGISRSLGGCRASFGRGCQQLRTISSQQITRLGEQFINVAAVCDVGGQVGANVWVGVCQSGRHLGDGGPGRLGQQR